MTSVKYLRCWASFPRSSSTPNREEHAGGADGQGGRLHHPWRAGDIQRGAHALLAQQGTQGTGKADTQRGKQGGALKLCHLAHVCVKPRVVSWLPSLLVVWPIGCVNWQCLHCMNHFFINLNKLKRSLIVRSVILMNYAQVYAVILASWSHLYRFALVCLQCLHAGACPVVSLKWSPKHVSMTLYYYGKVHCISIGGGPSDIWCHDSLEVLRVVSTTVYSLPISQSVYSWIVILCQHSHPLWFLNRPTHCAPPLPTSWCVVFIALTHSI